ncbi:MAG: hypothetical protein K2X38_23255 [Gemmataceae bacterium]|nr:hypothetical protein [Gemmataceae bacterium]
MSVNKFRPHVVVIPEDDANREVMVGFYNHFAVADRCVFAAPPAGGWQHVLDVFKESYIQHLVRYEQAYVVMVMDFDGRVDRRQFVEQDVPGELRPRVFLIAWRDEPEHLKVELGISFSDIGERLADECSKGRLSLWNHRQLDHNRNELARIAAVTGILFAP